MFDEERRQLQAELQRMGGQIVALQEEKKTLLCKNVTDDSFADTYEEVTHF
jgi:hypothetical protein